MKGNENCFQLAGGSSYGGLVLPGVKLSETQGKSIFVRVSAGEVQVSKGSRYRESTSVRRELKVARSDF